MSGYLFLILSDLLTLGACLHIFCRRKEFLNDLNYKSNAAIYYILSSAVFLFSFPFRASLGHNFILDSLWTWSACLEPLAVIPHCVAVVPSVASWLPSAKDGHFPATVAVSKLIAAITSVIYWLYITEARRVQYRRISALLLLLQSVGVCGAAGLAAVALKAEVAKRHGSKQPLLTLVIKRDSAKAI